MYGLFVAISVLEVVGKSEVFLAAIATDDEDVERSLLTANYLLTNALSSFSFVSDLLSLPWNYSLLLDIAVEAAEDLTKGSGVP